MYSYGYSYKVIKSVYGICAIRDFGLSLFMNYYNNIVVDDVNEQLAL